MIANLITLTNLWLGLYVIYYSGSVSIMYCSQCILLGTLLDCLDGPIARITGTTSRVGRILDHVADFITFGLGPVSIINNNYNEYYPDEFKLISGIWIVGNLYRELSPYTKNPDGDYIGCPSPFTAGIWAYGNIITAMYYPTNSELWCINSTNFLLYFMIDNSVYYHDRLIELDPLKSTKGFLNLFVILSIISTLIIQPVQTLSLHIPGIWTHTWGCYCIGYLIFGRYI